MFQQFQTGVCTGVLLEPRRWLAAGAEKSNIYLLRIPLKVLIKFNIAQSNKDRNCAAARLMHIIVPNRGAAQVPKFESCLD